MRRFFLVALLASSAMAQFEAVSIKLAEPGEALSIRLRGHEFLTAGTTLNDLIAYAYSVHPQQVVGGPGWRGTERFDIHAAAASAAGAIAPDDLKAMVRDLLSTRFGLSMHRELRELSVYALTRVPGSEPKLIRSDGDGSASAGVGFNGPGVMTVKSASMVDFAGLLQRYVLDRPAIDRTGIEGRYDFTLRWTPDAQLPDRTSQFAGMATANSGDEPPGLTAAVQQQLGLRLQAIRAAVEVIVLDRADKPEPN